MNSQLIVIGPESWLIRRDFERSCLYLATVHVADVSAVESILLFSLQTNHSRAWTEASRDQLVLAILSFFLCSASCHCCVHIWPNDPVLVVNQSLLWKSCSKNGIEKICRTIPQQHTTLTNDALVCIRIKQVIYSHSFSTKPKQQDLHSSPWKTKPNTRTRAHTHTPFTRTHLGAT